MFEQTFKNIDDVLWKEAGCTTELDYTEQTSWILFLKYLDDLPPMMFIKKSPNSHGFVNPRDIEQMWRDQFDWIYREYDYAVFTMTVHPDVGGRPQVLLMHERLSEHFNTHAGVSWATFSEIADDFSRRQPRP